MRRRIKEKNVSLHHAIRNQSGFTIIELIVALIILAVLATIALSVYYNYVNKAKVAIAESVLDNARDNLEIYYIDNMKYPDSIDFNGCIDEKSQMVFPSAFCTQLKKDIDSIESYAYNSDDNSYVLKARAKDTKKTLITLTPKNITKQDH